MFSVVAHRRTPAAAIVAFAALAAFGLLVQTGGVLASSGSSEPAGEWYVAPNGAPGNSGTKDRPLDLATALSTSSPAKPGDTIWLRGGLYEGPFRSSLQGTAAKPILVRAYPGEQPRLDGGEGDPDPSREVPTLRIGGSAHVWYWGLEIFSSWPDRLSTAEFPHRPPRARGIDDTGSGSNRIIHCIIHDTAMGVFRGSSARLEAYGNLSYYVGWEQPTRSDGHDWYVQNRSDTPPSLVEENIGLSGFGHGLHAYASNSVHRIHAIGNIFATKGDMSAISRGERNFLIGAQNSETAAIDPVVEGNFTYYPGTKGQNNIGYNGGFINARVHNNYWIGGSRSLDLDRSASDPDPANIALTGNVLYRATSPSGLSSLHPENTYYGTRRPTGIWTFVRPVGRYEPGRAHIIIYNWDLAGTVSVDLSQAGLASGQGYAIKDGYHFFGPSVASGTFDSRSPEVTISMTGLTLAKPVGNNIPVQPIHPAPEFGVFIVVPTGKQNPDEPGDPPAPPSGVRIVS